MRRVIGMFGVCAALAWAAPASADNAASNSFDFIGDKGTHCVVKVEAVASNAISAIELPQVGFSGDPSCTYAGASSGAGAPGALTPASSLSGAKAKKVCKRKGKARKRRCTRKGKRKRTAPRTSPPGSARAANPAALGTARLELIAPLGLPIFFGNKTLLSFALGYSCVLNEDASCSDEGLLLPAIPLLSYYSQFEFAITPPAGEAWVSVPSGCSGSPAQCTLHSPVVTPTLG
jgi:hypothetical protein